MSGIAAANLGITIGAQSDVVIIQSDVKTLQSDLVKTRSDMLITHSDVKAVNSDIKVLDPIIDTIKSDLIVTQSDVKVVISDLATLSTPVSTASATTTGVIVQDGTTGTPDVVQVTSSASANTFGSWVTLDAAVSADSWLCGFTISSYNDLAGDSELRWCVEIGTGASPAAKVRVSGQQCNTYIAAGGTSNFTIMPMFVSLPIPIKVASGTAVSARVAIREADPGGVTFHIGLSMYQSLET